MNSMKHSNPTAYLSVFLWCSWFRGFKWATVLNTYARNGMTGEVLIRFSRRYMRGSSGIRRVHDRSFVARHY
ncbi:hypothetical protein BD779DRAFT_1529977 [Infundibulicybe gibba]|nr:hypothetical protein BD779DRAFT_1529977 [Infundibulicybe gibba]